jgi:MoxR-like ATPase
MSTNFLDLPEPRSLQDTGIGGDQIEQLLVKTLYSGEATGLEIADKMCLPFHLLEPLIERLRNERLMEVKGSGGSGASTYRYALTDGGRDRARQYMEVSHYVGAAPVSLARYVAYMTALQAARGYMDKERLRNGFSHLIISDEVLEMVGPAVNAGKAVFLYGPPGNGKSVIAEGMGRSLGGDMYIPRAIDVDGHTVMMYDPIVHESLENPRESSLVVAAMSHDRRWVRIRRPVVMVGGELTLDMLDLRFNPTARFYEAPIQLKANGGVFLVDDFGRQRMRPQDLLNRWIVPLESRIDHLTLHSGKKFVVPFDTLVVFATNLPPESLADEAFLRRIPYKIAIEDPTLDDFTKIFELNCKRRNMRFHHVMVAYLQRRHYKPSGRPLRACHPRDLLDQVSALCRYRGVEPTITRELLDAACKSYFVGEAPMPQLPATPKSSARRMDVH